MVVRAKAVTKYALHLCSTIEQKSLLSITMLELRAIGLMEERMHAPNYHYMFENSYRVRCVSTRRTVAKKGLLAATMENQLDWLSEPEGDSDSR